MHVHPSPVVIGHRGACGYRPEHTRGAYELALQLGADYVEPDVVATKDGVLVLRHENEISQTTDIASRSEFAGRRTSKQIDGVEVTGWFTEDFTWAELSTLRATERLGALRHASASFDRQFPLVRLSNLFDLVDHAAETVDRPLGVVAELKHATYFESIGLPLDELFAETVRDAGWSEESSRLVVESFEKSVLGKVRARGIRATRVYLVQADGTAFDLLAEKGEDAPSYADELAGAGLYALATRSGAAALDGISVDKGLLLNPDGTASAELVDRAHGVGLAVFAWTLRAENAFLTPALRVGDDEARFGRWQDEFRAVMRTGVDGVFADHPDLAVVARDSLS